jgi:predicted Zn-dependent protease
MTRREERLRRCLRAVPVLALGLAALVFDHPWLLAGALAWGIGDRLVMRMHSRALNARLKALAGTLARDGDPAVATRSLEALVADARPYPSFHAIGLLFLGIARARTGDADGALDLLYGVQHSGWLAQRDIWLAWLLPWLAQLHAARGDLDLAQKWLDVARARLPEGRRDGLVSPEVLVALRLGRTEDAIAQIDAYIATADASDPVHNHFALLRAFAYERAGRPAPVEEVRALVAARLASPGRVLPVEKWWPDFAEFVGRHTPPMA